MRSDENRTQWECRVAAACVAGISAKYKRPWEHGRVGSRLFGSQFAIALV